MKVGGIVLCGGKSTRMGRPKAWLPFGDETMLGRVVRILREVLDPVVVVAAPDQEVPPLPSDVLVVRDAQTGRGPLQGLDAGLDALDGQADAAYASACDVPFLQASFIRRLIELTGDHAVCVPCVGGYHHSLAAVYRVCVLTAVRDLLAQDRLRPFFLYEAVPTRVALAHELRDADPEFVSLRNLNTPEDYALALAQFEGRS